MGRENPEIMAWELRGGGGVGEEVKGGLNVTRIVGLLKLTLGGSTGGEAYSRARMGGGRRKEPGPNEGGGERKSSAFGHFRKSCGLQVPSGVQERARSFKTNRFTSGCKRESWRRKSPPTSDLFFVDTS